jgi:hypothetical protein
VDTALPSSLGPSAEQCVQRCLQEFDDLLSDHYRRRPRLLIGHLEEQQVGELLDVVAIAHPVVAQDVR